MVQFSFFWIYNFKFNWWIYSMTFMYFQQCYHGQKHKSIHVLSIFEAFLIANDFALDSGHLPSFSSYLNICLLTPKGFWLCFHQECSKSAIWSTSIKFFFLKTFLDKCNHMILLYTSLKRCGKNFRNFLVDCKILAFVLTNIIFWALQKRGQLHFTRSHLYEKMSKMVVTLWIHSSSQVGYKLEKFKSLGIVKHVGKKSK